MTLPPWPGPVLRACYHCAASVYCTGWHDRCPKCGELIVGKNWLDVIDSGGVVVTVIEEDEP